MWFCEKRCFGRLRSCSYSWERIQSSFIKVSLMNALVCMQAEKRRLHAVPSCGSDRLKLQIREGHMLFWYGRCQQLTPPESRKMWRFRKKSKNISCVFLLLFFYFFGKISWNFWFFGVTLGKISSRSSQPWRKNKKRKFFGLFLAGRNLWNFGATPYCKSEQTRLYHNSAKSARIGLRF